MNYVLAEICDLYTNIIKLAYKTSSISILKKRSINSAKLIFFGSFGQIYHAMFNI